jgi:hypothetical protein
MIFRDKYDAFGFQELADLQAVLFFGTFRPEGVAEFRPARFISRLRLPNTKKCRGHDWKYASPKTQRQEYGDSNVSAAPPGMSLTQSLTS